MEKSSPELLSLLSQLADDLRGAAVAVPALDTLVAALAEGGARGRRARSRR